MKNKIISFTAILLLTALAVLFFACDSSSDTSDTSGEPTVVIPSGPVEIQITYNEGRVWQGTQVYGIWLENSTKSTVLPILITGRILNSYGQMATGLAYWRLNSRNLMTQAQIDAVTTATPNLPAGASDNLVGRQIATPIPAGATTRGRGGFSVIKNIPDGLRKFTVYFELEHSWDANTYFGDQPAILYKAVVDLDAFPASGEVNFVFAGWTPYSTVTIDGVSRPAGVLQTNDTYIKTVGAGEYPATDMMMNGAKVTIVP
ncbi:MAG: hypothetical protein JW982_06080 [Spirochaetes bacterium]|nr:hypothetical protein [Spirochaetota bacterium]